MRHGHIEDETRADILERADPPRHRIDTLGREHIFGIVTQIGGGCAFTQDARQRRLTRDHTNNMTPDGDGRLVDLRYESAVIPSVWSESVRPVREIARRER